MYIRNAFYICLIMVYVNSIFGLEIIVNTSFEVLNFFEEREEKNTVSDQVRFKLSSFFLASSTSWWRYREVV